MPGQNRIFLRQAHEPPSRHSPAGVMGAMERSPVRSVSMVFSCIVIIVLLVPALSQAKDGNHIPYPFELSRSAVFYSDSRSFRVHDDEEREGGINRVALSVNDTLTAGGEAEMTGGTVPRFNDGTMGYRTFAVHPSIIPSTDTLDQRRYLPSETVFYPDMNLGYGGEGAAYHYNRYDRGLPFVLFNPDIRSERTVHRVNVSPFNGDTTDDRLHEDLSDRITAFTETPEKPVALRPSDLPGIPPLGEERSKYSLYKDSELQNGGNVKLPLTVPWAGETTGRSGLLPDTIYLGTDINYFNIADNLQSWKSGNDTFSSDMNRLGSEWYDNRSGYIHFEWRLGK